MRAEGQRTLTPPVTPPVTPLGGPRDHARVWTSLQALAELTRADTLRNVVRPANGLGRRCRAVTPPPPLLPGSACQASAILSPAVRTARLSRLGGGGARTQDCQPGAPTQRWRPGSLLAFRGRPNLWRSNWYLLTQGPHPDPAVGRAGVAQTPGKQRPSHQAAHSKDLETRGRGQGQTPPWATQSPTPRACQGKEGGSTRAGVGAAWPGQEPGGGRAQGGQIHSSPANAPTQPPAQAGVHVCNRPRL